MPEVQPTGHPGRMATRSDRNVVEAEKTSVANISKTKREREPWLSLNVNRKSQRNLSINCSGHRYRLIIGKDRHDLWRGYIVSPPTGRSAGMDNRGISASRPGSSARGAAHRQPVSAASDASVASCRALAGTKDAT